LQTNLLVYPYLLSMQEELKEKQLLEQYKKYQNSFDKKMAQIHL